MQFDTRGVAGIDCVLTFPQARKSWGKAVKIGRGPATVIGC
jgi:hypothetical protein